MENIIQLFDSFLVLYKDNMWVETAVESEVKNAFKLANCVETVYHTLQLKDYAHEFDRITCTWQKYGKRCNSPPEVSVFERACNWILVVFLKNTTVKSTISLLAISEYIHFCKEDRLKGLISDLLTECISTRILFDLIPQLQDSCTLILDLNTVLTYVLNKIAHCGNREAILKTVEYILNDPERLGFLMRIVSAYEVEEEEDRQNMKFLILEMMLQQMHSKSNLSRALWRELVIRVDKRFTLSVCETSPQFLTVLLHFIESASCSVTYRCNVSRTSKFEWVNTDSDPILSGREFEALVELVECLLKSTGNVSKRTKRWLVDQKIKANCTVWEDIEAICDW